MSTSGSKVERMLEPVREALAAGPGGNLALEPMEGFKAEEETWLLGTQGRARARSLGD